MEKKQIARMLHRFYGRGLITTNQVAQFMGIGRETAAEMLDGLDFIFAGKNHAKAYLIDDVAEMIVNRRE